MVNQIMVSSGETEYDIVVAGSGPAGISAAIHLVQLTSSLGNRLIVLEKETHPRKKICGGGISAYADYWLQRLGIKMTIPFLALKKTLIAIDHDGYVEYCFDVGGFRTVKREEFDQALVQAALNLGIIVVQNEPVISFFYSDEAIIVQTTKRNLNTRVLVGADGAQSIIRKTLYRNAGKRDTKSICSTLRFMARADGRNYPDQRAEEAVIDFSCTYRHGIRGYAWSFPVIIEGQTWLNTGVGGFFTSKKDGSLLKKILAEFLASRGILFNEDRVEGGLLRWFHPESIFSADRVLLVGDAAGVDPLWGEGISFSLGYGHVAADAIVGALKSNDFSFTTYKDQLLEHEVGRELMYRLQWADKLYRPQKDENVKDILLSLLLPRREA
jgi:flavin-dependent dehydrogenase